MPIMLEPPHVDPRGPDGQGWNRLTIAHYGRPGAQCALRPRSYESLLYAHNTPLASWGGYGPCTQQQKGCTHCPRLAALQKGERLEAFGPAVLVRLRDRTVGDGLFAQTYLEPWLMNKPQDGWASWGMTWPWEKIARLRGWDVGPRYRDDDGDGFWLLRQTRDGQPGPATCHLRDRWPRCSCPPDTIAIEQCARVKCLPCLTNGNDRP